MVRDGVGLVGSVFHYSMLIALVGSAFLIFCYLWRKGRLDMDEEPKHQMLETSEEEREFEENYE